MTIDYTQLQTFINCPRKYQLRFIKCLRKLRYDERDVDKDFGSCIHGALKEYYTSKNKAMSLTYFKEQYSGLVSTKIKTPANGMLLLDRYFEWAESGQGDLADNNFTTLEVEQVNTYKINDIDYLVKPDMIINNNAGNWVLDHKTTKSIPYNYFYQFNPNMQVSGYCNYVKRNYGQCSGMIVNALCFGVRERRYKDRPAGFWFEPSREIIERTHEQLVDFESNVIEWVDKLKLCEITNNYPKNESACHQYRGCSYKEICSSCNDEQIQATLYEVYDSKEYLK